MFIKEHFITLCASLFILASCDSPQSGEAGKKVDSATNSAVGLCDSFAVSQFAMDTLRAAELSEVFLASYRHGNAEGRFAADEASVTISTALMMEFESLAPTLDPATQCLGVRIAYGLDEDARPSFLFAPIVMTRTASAVGTLDFSLGEPDKYYVPVGNAWQHVDAAVAQSATQRYAELTMKYVGRDLKPLTIDPSLGSASDPSSTFFPFTEFRELIRENEQILTDSLGTGNDLPSITAIRMRWAAEILGDDGTLKQVVVMIPVLDGPDYPGPARPLTLKAADFNALCPPQCDQANYSAVR